MTRFLRWSAPCALGFVLFGCAAVNPRAGFGDVTRLVGARSSVPVRWPEDDAGERAVDATVDALLAEPLTADTAMRIAVLNNRSLRALYHELGVPEAELAQAGLLPNPVLNANVRVGLGPSGTGTELGLVQDLIGMLQIPLKKRVAAAKLATAKLAVADAILDLALVTKTTFYRLQGAEQTLELRRHVVTAAAAARRVAERQHAAGTVTDLALATELAAHEDALAEVGLAETSTRAEREDLNVLLGVTGERTAWTLAPRLADAPDDDLAPTSELEARALTQRLDLALARVATEGERAQYRLGRFYGVIPTASLGTAAHREVEGGWSVGPALELPIPLFDRSQAALAATASRIHAGEERAAALAVKIRADVRRARARVDAARIRATQFRRTLLPLASRVSTESQREYNAMLIGVFQLLTAKRAEIETGRRYVEALTDYWIARTDLERAVGAELPLAHGAPATAMPLAAPATGIAQHHHGG